MKAYLKFKEDSELHELPFTGTPAEMREIKNTFGIYGIRFPEGKMLSHIDLTFVFDLIDSPLYAVFEVEAF